MDVGVDQSHIRGEALEPWVAPRTLRSWIHRHAPAAMSVEQVRKIITDARGALERIRQSLEVSMSEPTPVDWHAGMTSSAAVMTGSRESSPTGPRGKFFFD